MDQNPYESPRQASRFFTWKELARRAWIKDRLMLWECGLLFFFVSWLTLLMVWAIAWALGHPMI
jgi:hypothetical protein